MSNVSLVHRIVEGFTLTDGYGTHKSRTITTAGMKVSRRAKSKRTGSKHHAKRWHQARGNRNGDPIPEHTQSKNTLLEILQLTCKHV